MASLERGAITDDELMQSFEGEPEWSESPDFTPGSDEDFGPLGPPEPDIPVPDCEMLLDCTDAIVRAAEAYQLPARCSDEDDIASLSPSAVCEDSANVLITINAKRGATLSPTATCAVGMTRGVPTGALLNYSELAVIESDSDSMTVRLAKATRSGCIGFYGGSQRGPSAEVSSCLKLGGMSDGQLAQLLAPRLGDTTIPCTGSNLFRVVGQPEIDTLHAQGPDSEASSGASSSVILTAEACTDVTLSWKFDFGSETTYVDPQEFIRVSLLRNGLLIHADLPPDASYVASDEVDATYEVVAVASVDGRECGRKEGTFEIGRFKAVHLSGANKVRIGQAITITARVSCPAPASGITVTLSVSPSSALQVPASVTVPASQVAATFQATGTGSDCRTATLTASASQHESAAKDVCIFDQPVITSITPTTVTACRAFDLTLNGDCFACGSVEVIAERGGSRVELAVGAHSESTIECSGQDLRPGTWSITVETNGLTSDDMPLSVMAPPVVIELFSVETADGLFIPCEANLMSGLVIARDTSRIVVKRGDSVVEDVEFDGCPGTVDVGFADSIERKTDYRVEAHPLGGGVPTTMTLSAGERGTAKLSLKNDSDTNLVVWKIPGWVVNFDVELLPVATVAFDLPADGGVLDLTFANCSRFTVAVLDKDMAEDQGWDPFGNAIEHACHVLVPSPVFVGETGGEEVSLAWW